jgi:hypothetical protein
MYRLSGSIRPMCASRAGSASIRRRTTCIACRADPAITALAFSCVYVGKQLEPVGGELFTLVAKSAHLAGLPDVPDRFDLARRQDVRLSDRR